MKFRDLTLDPWQVSLMLVRVCVIVCMYMCVPSCSAVSLWHLNVFLPKQYQCIMYCVSLKAIGNLLPPKMGSFLILMLETKRWLVVQYKIGWCIDKRLFKSNEFSYIRAWNTIQRSKA